MFGLCSLTFLGACCFLTPLAVLVSEEMEILNAKLRNVNLTLQILRNEAAAFREFYRHACPVVEVTLLLGYSSTMYQRIEFKYC